MDRIASFLRRKISNVKIDPWLRLARIFVVAYQKFARPEDVERFLVKNAVGSGPPINLLGQGTQGRARRKKFVAGMCLKHEGRGQHEHRHNPEAK
jgi:hypothetical protein